MRVPYQLSAKVLFVVILFFSIGIRLISINQSLWLDEAAQVIESARPLSQQLHIKGDFQPPLFHLLLHFWMRLGASEKWMRILPITFGVFSVATSYFLAKWYFSEKIALLCMLLLASNPFHIWYSLEIRPYSLAVFTSLIATVFLLRGHYKSYILASILGIYSTYLVPFMLLAHGVYIISFRRFHVTKWLGSIIIIVFAFLPWLPNFLEQLGIGSNLRITLPGWSEAVSTPLVKALPLAFTKFMLGRISFENKVLYGTIVGLFSFIFALLLYLDLRRYFKKSIRIALFVLVPITGSYGLSFLLPVFAPQRLLFVLPYMLLLISLGIVQVHKKYRLLTFIPFMLICTYSMYLYTFVPHFQREDWYSAVVYVEKHNIDTAAVFVFPDAFAPWQWYSSGKIAAIALAPEFVLSQNSLSSQDTRLLQYKRLLVFNYLTDLTDPGHILPDHLVSIGYTREKIIDVPGVGFITTYEKNHNVL